MEKMIQLIKDPDCIAVFVNDEEKFRISNKNKMVSAKDIYDAIAFSNGDHLVLEQASEEDMKDNSFKYFFELFQMLSVKLNEIATTNTDKLNLENEE